MYDLEGISLFSLFQLGFTTREINQFYMRLENLLPKNQKMYLIDLFRKFICHASSSSLIEKMTLYIQYYNEKMIMEEQSNLENKKSFLKNLKENRISLDEQIKELESQAQGLKK